jgi:hypothetical protein
VPAQFTKSYSVVWWWGQAIGFARDVMDDRNPLHQRWKRRDRPTLTTIPFILFWTISIYPLLIFFAARVSVSHTIHTQPHFRAATPPASREGRERGVCFGRTQFGCYEA